MISTKDTSINLTNGWISNFLSLQNKGPDQTFLKTESSLDISNVRNKEMIFSKEEFNNFNQYNFTFGFHRLSINDKSSNGNQPINRPNIYNTNGRKLNTETIKKLFCSGEIYNWKKLLEKYNLNSETFISKSDIEIIIELYDYFQQKLKLTCEESLLKVLNEINGEYSFILSDNLNTYFLDKINLYVVRDPIGLKPIYVVKNNKELFYLFTSELKGIPKEVLQDSNNNWSISQIPPGSFWSFNTNIIKGIPLKTKLVDEFYHYINFRDYSNVSNLTIPDYSPENTNLFNSKLINLIDESITSRIPQEEYFGLMYSGGFQSNLLLFYIVDYLVKNSKFEILEKMTVFQIQNETQVHFDPIVYLNDKYKEHANFKLNYSKIVINENNINIKELMKIIEEIIYSCETFDPEVIRDSIPYYLFLNIIKQTNNKIKILITGEGLNEHGGYTEFNNLTIDEFQNYSIKLIEEIYLYDLTRIEKIYSNSGFESRHPFLDLNFVKFLLDTTPKYKKKYQYSNENIDIDKFYIRNNFKKLIPNEILWNKSQCICQEFDFDIILKKIYDSYYSNDFFEEYKFKILRKQLKFILPKNKEEMAYQLIFSKLFGTNGKLLKKYWG